MPKFPTGGLAPLGDLPIGGGRRAGAEDFGSGVGEAISQVGGTVQKVATKAYDDIGEAEARTALISSTEIRAKYAKRLDEAAINGEDLGKIQEEMNNELSQVGDGFATKKGQQQLQFYTANSNIMFDQASSAIQVKRAGAEAQLQGQKFLKNTAALINSNPSYLTVAEKDVDAFTQTLVRVPPEQRAKINEDLRNNLNVTAALAAGRLDPWSTKQKLEEGEWDLTPEQRTQAINAADAQIRARRTDETYARAEKEYQQKEMDETARGEWLKSVIGGTATAKAILEDGRLFPTTQEHMIGLMEQRAREQRGEGKASDPVTYNKLWMAVNAPDGEPGKIYNADEIFAAVKSGLINTTDANKLMGQLSSQRDENGRSLAVRLQGRISTVAAAMRAAPQYAAQPELAAAIQNQMVVDVEQKSAALRQANKNPEALLDPNSPDFYFTPNRIKMVADDVSRQMEALRPKLPDLRTNPNDWSNVPVGTPFIDPNGVTRTMTKELQEALQKGQTPAAPAPKAEPSAANKAYGAAQDAAAIERGDLVEKVMTGGKGLVPDVEKPESAAGKLFDEYKAASAAYSTAVREFSSMDPAKVDDKTWKAKEAEVARLAKAKDKAFDRYQTKGAR